MIILIVDVNEYKYFIIEVNTLKLFDFIFRFKNMIYIKINDIQFKKIIREFNY